MTQKIREVSHWMLGDYKIEPPVPVVNTDFVSWKPGPRGRYSEQAVYYSVMHPHVMRRDSDLRGQTPKSSVFAHNRSMFNAFGVVDMASRHNVVDEKGKQLPPISPQDADKPAFYEGRNLRLDTEGMRRKTAEMYRRLGYTITWQGEAPQIPCPVDNDYFFPEDPSRVK